MPDQNNNVIQQPVEASTVVNSPSPVVNVATPVVNASAPVPLAKQSSNKTLIVLLIVGVILLCCCGCSAVWGYGMYVGNTVDEVTNNLTIDTAEPTPTPTSYLTPTVVDSKSVTPNFKNMPGTTICDSILCSDVWSYVVISSNIYDNKDNSCSNTSLQTTKLVSQSADKKTWNEMWTITVCGKESNYDIQYTADSTGTGFSVSKSK